jgi:hypothetical protein
MMGLDTPETCTGSRNILRISCASSWVFFTRFFSEVKRSNSFNETCNAPANTSGTLTIGFWFIPVVSSEPHPVILNMKAALSPEMSERTYYSTPFNNQEDHQNNALCETLKRERGCYISRLHTGLCIPQICLLIISGVCCNRRLFKLRNFSLFVLR